MKNEYLNPEPVPTATQLSLMPFLAAVQGALTVNDELPNLRLTMHRVMSREGGAFLQQASGYFPIIDPDRWSEKSGRIFPVNQGIIGKSYETGAIYRTKRFEERSELMEELKLACAESGQNVEEVGTSYLSVPILDADSNVVLVLYAECKEMNFFADDDRVRQVIAMCKGLCELFDVLQENPFPNLRNFSLESGTPVKGKRTAYQIQEPLDLEPPKFEKVVSFNFEASAA